jgi:hypothetical protein
MKLNLRTIFTVIAIFALSMLAGDIAIDQSQEKNNTTQVKAVVTCDSGAGCIEDITFPAMHITTIPGQ